LGQSFGHSFAAAVVPSVCCNRTSSESYSHDSDPMPSIVSAEHYSFERTSEPTTATGIEVNPRVAGPCINLPALSKREP
jgi:hypothetical protein